jgi:hypothetical protein
MRAFFAVLSGSGLTEMSDRSKDEGPNLNVYYKRWKVLPFIIRISRLEEVYYMAFKKCLQYFAALRLIIVHIP